MEEEEIAELKRAYLGLRRKIEDYGPKRSDLALAMRLKELMEELGATVARSKELRNPALITRVKLAKKGYKISKNMLYFEREVAAEFEKGDLSENAGRRLIAIIGLIKENKLDAAKKEFGYFDAFMELNRQCEAAKGALEEKGRVLRREEHRVGKTLEEMDWLEKQAVDLGKVRRHEELLEDVALLEKAREAYVGAMLSMPAAEVLDAMEKRPVKGMEIQDPAALKGFFARCPALGRCTVEELCGLFDVGERKLSHLCPDTAGFKRIVAGNRSLFEAIRSKRFPQVDVDDDWALDFYGPDTADRARALRPGRQEAREEYERSAMIEKKRSELSRYTRKGLEAELARIRRLLALLESEEEQKKGLLDMLKSAFS